MDESVSYHFATVKQTREKRHEIKYDLKLRQQPKQSRMCGVGEKADRRPIDPPPIVQLRVYDPSLSMADQNSYLQNPYYFMYASLMAADLDEELHLLRDGKTRSTTGSVVSSLYHLKDIDNSDAGFFVFPDISVRMEGSYRLKLSLFEIIGKDVFHCKSIISDKFVVYSAKKFPGMEESTFLSRAFADQGLKIRIRKELRQRRKISRRKGSEDLSASHEEEKAGKRSRITDESTTDKHKTNEPSKEPPDDAIASQAPVLQSSYNLADGVYHSISSPDSIVDQSRRSTISSPSNVRDFNQVRPYHLSAQRTSSYSLSTNLHTHYSHSQSAVDTYPIMRPASEPTLATDMDPISQHRIHARSWVSSSMRAEPIAWQSTTSAGRSSGRPIPSSSADAYYYDTASTRSNSYRPLPLDTSSEIILPHDIQRHTHNPSDNADSNADGRIAGRRSFE